jgi:hypothetical protein
MWSSSALRTEAIYIPPLLIGIRCLRFVRFVHHRPHTQDSPDRRHVQGNVRVAHLRERHALLGMLLFFLVVVVLSMCVMYVLNQLSNG